MTNSDNYAIAVIGAGGKMGMRISNNLARTSHRVRYVENSIAGQRRTVEAGRELTAARDAVIEADVVVFAVPDLALQSVTAELVPQMKPGSIALTQTSRCRLRGRTPVSSIDLPEAHDAGGVCGHLRWDRCSAGCDRRDRVRRSGEEGSTREYRACHLRPGDRRSLRDR
jgi:hypothetical protein